MVLRPVCVLLFSPDNAQMDTFEISNYKTFEIIPLKLGFLLL
jgi:hypothetical protein